MIEVIASGLFTSIQDQGRFGFRNQGVPVSGCMDNYSAQVANALVNNDKNAAVLEMMYQGATLKFNHDAFIVVTGAICSITINNKTVKPYQIQKVNKYDLLKIGRVSQGVYIYLAIAGGFKAPKILNSTSFYPNITHTKISKNDILQSHNCSETIINRSAIKQEFRFLSDRNISGFKGPEFNSLDPQTQKTLLNNSFTLSANCNRMAYKLNKNKSISANEIITSCVQAGTVQLTPNGELIVLMRDCQTTGGYARVLQLDDQAINQLAQKPISSRVSFKF